MKEEIIIQAPNLKHSTFDIIGTAPLVMNKFSAKAREEMKEKQIAGSVAKSKRKREPKNFDNLYNGYRHISQDGWDGLPATAIKAAMVSACRTIDYKMTRAKLAFFIQPDGFDKDDRSPLIKILKGEPKPLETYVRLSTGVPDIIIRPVWDAGWEAKVTITFDADMLSQQDIANLLFRAGTQVGICAGRPSSTNSVGQGWGTFKLGGKK